MALMMSPGLGMISAGFFCARCPMLAGDMAQKATSPVAAVRGAAHEPAVVRVRYNNRLLWAELVPGTHQSLISLRQLSVGRKSKV